MSRRGAEQDSVIPTQEGIIIAGAGPVGAVCALALKQGGLDPLVLEARPEHAPVNDRRTLALSYGSRLLLERLGIWSRIQEATPIKRFHISHRGGLGRAFLSAQEEKLPALGYVLRYGELARALADGLQQGGVRMRFGVQPRQVQSQDGLSQLHLAGDAAETMTARLVVIADGGRGEDAAPPKWSHDNARVAVVAEVMTELPHHNLAYERFTPNGPIALPASALVKAECEARSRIRFRARSGKRAVGARRSRARRCSREWTVVARMRCAPTRWFLPPGCAGVPLRAGASANVAQR